MKTVYFQLCFQGFFFWLAYDLSRFPVIPLYAQKLGLSPEAIGLAVAASTVTGIFGKSIAGGLSDSLGRRLMMIAACVVAFLLPCLYFLVQGAGSLIALRLVHGLGTAIMGPVGRAFVSDIVSPEHRGNRLSTFTAVTNLGTMAARSLGGFLLFWGGFFYPFAASALAGLIALGIAFRWAPDRKHPFDGRFLAGQWVQGIREVGSNRAILATSVVEAIQYFALGLVDAFLPIYAKGRAGLDDWQIGLLYGVQMGAIILMKPVMGWVSDRWGRKPQIVLGLALGAAVLWRMPWETGFAALVILSVLFGLTVAVTTSATTAYVTDLCRQERYGAAHGLFGTILDIGHAAGPIASGILIARLDYRPAFGITAGLLIIASLFYQLLIRRTP